MPNLIRKIKRRIQLLRHGAPSQRRATDDPSFMDRKNAKLKRIESILRDDLPAAESRSFMIF